MEQDERAVTAEPSELSTEQGGEGGAPATAALAGEVAGAEEVHSSVRVAASEGAKKQDLEEPSPESVDEVAAASGGAESKDCGAFENPTAARFAPTVAIAHASPPDSYRRRPSRSRKHCSPKRFVAAPGSAASDATASSSSSSGGRAPSRGRKHPRPAHFIREEAEATVRAKARRSAIALDRFLTSLLRGSSASKSEWARNVTAGNTASGASGSGSRAATPPVPACCGPRSAASEPHAAACSPTYWRRLRGVLWENPTGDGDSTACSPSSARRRRRLSCVLFYIVGQRRESVP